MADEKFTPEVEKTITEAGSSEQIRDIVVAQPRDAQGKFAVIAAAKEPPKEEKKEEAVEVKDTFLIGGKSVEFTGNDAADILKQVKVAQQAYEMGRPKIEEKKEPTVEEKAAAAKTRSEELAALQLKAAAGDPNAMFEYMEKSGAMDRWLESKGIKPAEIKQVLEENASAKVVKDWDGAVKEFLAESDWPGGTQNEKLLKYKLAELKDANNQPLAYSPSKASLQTAYEALKAEGMLFAREEVTTEEKKTTGDSSATSQSATASTTAASTGTVTGKRAATSSTAFGTSQEQGARKTAATAPKVPVITDDMTGQQIMEVYKQASLAAGQSPDEGLRAVYSGKA